MTANLLTLTTIGIVHLLAAMSPGPSFLVTARTAVAQSRADGIKVALVPWRRDAHVVGRGYLRPLLIGRFHRLFMGMKVTGALFLLWIAHQIVRHAADPVVMHEEANIATRHGSLLRGF